MAIIGTVAQVTANVSQHYNIYVRVDVYRSDGSPVLSGGQSVANRFIRGSISATIDDAARRLSATFDLGIGSTSLSPLMFSADVNLPGLGLGFMSGGAFQINVAILPPGVPPTDADYFELDAGRIEQVDMGTPGEITITGRDLYSAFLLNRWVEVATAYGDGATLISGVMEQILAQWAPGLGHIGDVVGGSVFANTATLLPDWVPIKFTQSETSVLDALRTLALQIGWDLRTFPRFPAPTTGFSLGALLVLYDPTAFRFDTFITPGLYTQITALGVDDSDVRNVIDVFYFTDKALRNFVHREDAASVLQYGRRYERISEDLVSNIDTLAEATKLCEAALRDQKDPFATHAISMPLWPWVELNDLQTYAPNNVHYDLAQTFAVVSYTHEFTQGSGTTSIQARGQPIAAYRAYRQGAPRSMHVSLEVPPGIGPVGSQAIPAKERALWVQVPSLDFP